MIRVWAEMWLKIKHDKIESENLQSDSSLYYLHFENFLQQFLPSQQGNASNQIPVMSLMLKQQFS